MSNHSRLRRSTASARAGRERARLVAARLGTALREARITAGLTQARLAERARLSQSLVSRLERGLGASASLETWALAASAAGEQLVSFLERASGATLPRDAEHLRRQELVIALASRGGWQARPELAVPVGHGRPRSVDVALVRPAGRELAVVEVWDLLEDVGAALRSLDEKRLAIQERHPGWTVGALWIVRGTRRNRRLVAEHPRLFASRFVASSAGWHDALVDETAPMPSDAGLLWTDVAGVRIVEWTPGRGRGGQGSPGATRPRAPARSRPRPARPS